MSTSWLSHAFGVRDYQYLKSRLIKGRVVFAIEQKPETLRCSACGSEEVIRQGSVSRSFHAQGILAW